MVKTLLSNAGGAGLIPGQGTKIPHASWLKNPKHKTEVIWQQWLQSPSAVILEPKYIFFPIKSALTLKEILVPDVQIKISSTFVHKR